MTNIRHKSDKYYKVLKSLPQELQGYYEQMVEEYSYHTLKLYGRNWVAYEVIGELIKEGWRPPVNTTPKSKN